MISSKLDFSKEYVLVVDDSPPNRKIVALVLRKLGFRVLESHDGEAAWHLMDENREKNVVAVISDLVMPNANGVELLRRVRADAFFQNLPFVFVTAMSERDSISEVKELNAQGCILKPVTVRRMSQKLQEIFPARKFANAS